MNNSFIWM